MMSHSNRMTDIQQFYYGRHQYEDGEEVQEDSGRFNDILE